MTISGYCCKCRNPIYEHQFSGDQLVDNFVYDFDGYLDYIELAHVECKPNWKRERE